MGRDRPTDSFGAFKESTDAWAQGQAARFIFKAWAEVCWVPNALGHSKKGPAFKRTSLGSLCYSTNTVLTHASGRRLQKEGQSAWRLGIWFHAGHSAAAE